MIKLLNHKYFILLAVCFSTYSSKLNAQAQPKESEPTRQQALDYLKNTLSGQIKHYSYGDPLDNSNSRSYYFPSQIEIISVNLIYDVVEVKIKSIKSNEIIVYKTSLRNEFESYEHCICTVKDKTAPVPEYPKPVEAKKRYGNVFICLDDNSSMMDKTINAMVFLRKFITKDPFEN